MTRSRELLIALRSPIGREKKKYDYASLTTHADYQQTQPYKMLKSIAVNLVLDLVAVSKTVFASAILR
jgi:hypothetical protein